MKKSTIVIIICIIVVLVGLVYYFSNSNSTTPVSTQTNSEAPMIPASPTTMLALTLGNDPTLGSYLTSAGNSMTLYTYKLDSAGNSTCTGACAATWPPYTISSTSPSTLTGVSGITGAIGTITRDDGSIQVTYNGLPLYFYSQDVNQGDINGNNVGNFVIAMP